MTETCGALDTSITETLFYCSLPLGHQPANEHRSDYLVLDTDNPPYGKPAVHEWTDPVSA